MNLKAVGGCLLGLSMCAVGGACQAGSAPVPLQAELVKQMDLKHLASGAAIRARVTVDWSGPGCVLRRGAALEGTVETVQPRNSSTPSSVALAFRRAQCNGGELTPMSLVIVALAQAPQQIEVVPGISFAPASGPYDAPSRPTGAVSDMGSPRKQVSTAEHHFPAKAAVSTGDVLDIKDLKLSAGTGPNRSSVLTAERGDVNLKQYTQMLLVPELLMFAPRPDAPATPAPDSSTPQPQSAPSAEPAPATPPSL
jgi:hypothetical protein